MENDKPGERLSLAIPHELSGQRLDQALAELLPDRSRSFLRKLLDGGRVALNKQTPKAGQKVKGGERVDLFIPPPQPLEANPEDLPLDVLYEDDHIIVVNKRPGMVAHPSQGHRGGTLVNALLHHYGDSLSGIGGALRPGIVHRLDRDTSGCLAAAKNDAAHHKLMEQFMEREVGKIYLAITDGVPRPVSGKVEGNIGRSRSDRKLHAMLKTGGRHSLTLYRTLENYGAVALVECELKTGRTHQARVHLAHLGSPVLCDRDYGKRGAFTTEDARKARDIFAFGTDRGGIGEPARVLLDRQALHAWRLSFRHPASGGELRFEAPLPADMASVLAPLREARDSMERRDGGCV